MTAAICTTRAKRRSRPASSRPEEALEVTSFRPRAELLERTSLDLADALACEGQLAPDLFERVLALGPEAEAHAHDTALALGEPGKEIMHVVLERVRRDLVLGR